MALGFERPESSVSVIVNEWGEEICSGDAPGPVIHRTPEELGIPRVVADRPERVLKDVRSDFTERERFRSDSNRLGVKRDRPRRECSSTSTKRSVSTMNSQTGGAATVGRKPGIPTKRYAAPSIATVAMDDVPESAVSERISIAGDIYAKLCTLPVKSALKVDFESETHAAYVRAKVRGMAKKDGRFASSSRSADGKTRWFWLESA